MTLKSHLETSRNYVLTTCQTYTNSQVTDTYIMHGTSHQHSYPTLIYHMLNQYQLIIPNHGKVFLLIPKPCHWITNHHVYCCSCQIRDHIYIQPLKYNSYKAYVKLTIHKYNHLPIMHNHSRESII